MVLSVVLSLAGLIPVLVDKKLLPIADKKYHPLVGLATLVVAFVQPFIGYFRPSKDHQFRPLFKLFHTFFGYSAILMGIASIFLTNDLEVDISLQPQLNHNSISRSTVVGFDTRMTVHTSHHHNPANNTKPPSQH